MAAWWIWSGALALYAVFLLWYDNWVRVMSADLSGIEKRWDTFERYYAVRRA